MKTKCLLITTACAAVLVVLVAIGIGGPTGHADSIVLRNQSTIHGKARKEAGKIIIQFGSTGEMAIPEEQVLKIIKNDLDDFELRAEEGDILPAADTAAVVVTMKADMDPLGVGRYIGWEGPSDDDSIFVLRLPGGGILRLPRECIESVEVVERRSEVRPAVESPDGAIRTTHVVHLVDGRKILGNVVEDIAGQPLKVEIGDLGILLIRRGRIEKIEEKEGSYAPAAPAASVGAPDEPKPIPQADLEKLKKQLKQEILRELLEGILDEKVDKKIEEAIGEGKRELSMESAAESLTTERIEEIQHLVYEIGRHRSRNRVRAEAALADIGPAVLPFLKQAATHPFELTRRAVQRIVRDIGDIRGAPYAIGALTDTDAFVREIAAEALRSLLGLPVAYSPSAPAAQRQAAQARYREVWDEIQREHLRDAVAQRF
ncbi:MAG: HEAT repeat domain-containing protein [Planctomycetes bacterium]|nr:HEAT repeat domain-containing protein [Planctomycetota bacterium]